MSRASPTKSKHYLLVYPLLQWNLHHSQTTPTDGSKQRYMNPPVPRRLVCQIHIPPNLFPSYSDPSSHVSGIRLDSKHREVRTGTQADIQFHRLPVQPQGGQGQPHRRMLAHLKDLEASDQPLLWGHVRQLMSLIGLLTATEK